MKEKVKKEDRLFKEREEISCTLYITSLSNTLALHYT